MSAISAVSSGMTISGGPGEAKSIVEGTLSENAKMANWYQAPVKIPDTNQMFPIGGNINLQA
jgi:hypothetical protein